ncbi:MAG: M15 family metallopeptidase [Deltaproteobacteria bacterium]|nr:M15 family metallopeptidase [Deltaproteobacteria bacterium]
MNRWSAILLLVGFVAGSQANAGDVEISANDLLGKFSRACGRAGFVSLGNGKCLRGEVAKRYREMADAAWKEAKIRLWVPSATRTFADQKTIWERKWRKEPGATDDRARALRILQWSSMPGTSRHHWGTDVDLGHPNCGGDCLVDAAWTSAKGRPVYEWLEKNASRFGFCQPYRGAPGTRNGGKFAHGYGEERWHWSYRPLAARFLARYVEILSTLRPVKGAFLGAEAGAEFFESFVRNIDANCAP